MILAFFFITFYQNNTGSVRLCDEFDILPQSSSPNNNNKGGGGGGGGGQGAYISSPLKGMVVTGNRSSEAHQYHRCGGGESGFSPPSSSMIDHDAGWKTPTLNRFSHAMCVLYELNLANVMNAVQSDHTGPSDAIDEENRRKK